MVQVVPGPDSAWVAEEWVAAAGAALGEVGAAGVVAPEGVVRVVAACGNPGVEVEELAVEAAPVEVVAARVWAVEELGLGELAVPAVPVELAVGVVGEVEDMEVDLDPAVDPGRALEGREAEAIQVRREDG